MGIKNKERIDTSCLDNCIDELKNILLEEKNFSEQINKIREKYSRYDKTTQKAIIYHLKNKIEYDCDYSSAYERRNKEYLPIFISSLAMLLTAVSIGLNDVHHPAKNITVPVVGIICGLIPIITVIVAFRSVRKDNDVDKENNIYLCTIIEMVMQDSCLCIEKTIVENKV